jgi:hypothetical protein
MVVRRKRFFSTVRLQRTKWCVQSDTVVQIPAVPTAHVLSICLCYLVALYFEFYDNG